MDAEVKRPNIVFIIDDQHRWDFMGYESGNGVTFTPNLDLLARRGASFRSAYCTSPLCSPSSSGCFTNLHRPPADSPSFVRQFQSAGYRTAVVGKTHMEIHGYTSDYTTAAHASYMRSLGWDEVREISGNGMLKAGIECFYTSFLKEKGVFDRVTEFYKRWAYFMGPEEVRRSKPHDWHYFEWPLDEEYQESRWVADETIRWMNRYTGEALFLLHVGFAAPHSPARLYDLKADPHESHDLIADPDSQDILRRMQEKLLIRLNENRQTQPNQDRGRHRPL